MPTEEKTTEQESDFREEQKAKAASQGLTSDNAVPEQRPIASQVVTDTEGPISQKLREAGQTDDEPMPESAYEKAASDSQMKKAAKESVSEPIHVGHVIRVTEGPHEGRLGAVVRIVSYKTVEDRLARTAGTREAGAHLSQPSEIEVSTRDERGGELLIVDADDVEIADPRNYGRRIGV